MSLLFPWALAWSAAGAAVAILYMLRRRERQLPVSALYLWEQVPPDAMSRVARWLPRTDLLLWTQILIVLLMAWALAAPTLTRPRPAGPTVVIVDCSLASAPEGRMDEARDAARELVRGSAGPWVLVRWADPPQLAVGPTTREVEVLAAINGLSHSLSAPPPLSHALALVPQDWDRVVLISGAPPTAAPAESVQLPPVENRAIEAFSVRAHPDGSGYEALVTVRNNTGTYQDIAVSVRDVAGGRSFQQSRLLPPKERDTFLFPLWGAVSPAYVAQVSPEDAFPHDDVRYCSLELSSALGVRWIGAEDRYLWAALRAAAPAERQEAPPWDLTVAVGEDLDAPVEGPVLLVDAGLPEATRAELVPAGEWHAREDVLLQHVETHTWASPAVRELTLPPEAIVPLRAGDVPALARWTSPGGRRVALAVPLERTNLPVTMGFPVMLRNAIAWLLPAQEGRQLTVGESLNLESDRFVRTPSGEVHRVWVPEEPGLFEMAHGDRSHYLAVNVPDVQLNAEGEGSISMAEPVAQETPVWPWVAALALAFLGGEWWLARRRGA